MKKVVSVLFILAIIVFSVLMVSYSSDQKPEKVLRHVVMFGFKPDVSEAQVKEVEDAFEQLGVPVREGKEVAVDAIFDSVSVATTYRDKLAEQGIIFCSFGEAIHDHPELVKQYLDRKSVV